MAVKNWQGSKLFLHSCWVALLTCDYPKLETHTVCTHLCHLLFCIKVSCCTSHVLCIPYIVVFTMTEMQSKRPNCSKAISYWGGVRKVGREEMCGVGGSPVQRWYFYKWIAKTFKLKQRAARSPYWEVNVFTWSFYEAFSCVCDGNYVFFGIYLPPPPKQKPFLTVRDFSCSLPLFLPGELRL